MNHCIVKKVLESGKLQPGQQAWAESLCCRDRKSLEEYLRLIPDKPTYKPTLYRDSTCSICHEKGVPCFSVLSSWKHGGHYLNGQQMACIRCLTTGRWNDAD